MILCRSVHKYITFCSEPLIRTLIRRIKCRISASQTFITYTMRIKSANITQKNKIFLFFFKNGCLLICLRIFIRISTVSYSSHSHQRRSYPARIFSSDSSGNSSHEVLPATFSNADSSILVSASYCS